MMIGRSLVALAFALALAACGQQEGKQPEQPAVQEPVTLEAEPWRGFPSDQSVSIDGNTLNIPVGGGAMRVVNNPNAAVGDTLSARLRLTARSAAPVRVALFRHCNAELGNEGDSREITLSPEETSFTLQHSFSQPYECVRVHIVSVGQPAVVTVNEFVVTRE